MPYTNTTPAMARKPAPSRPTKSPAMVNQIRVRKADPSRDVLDLSPIASVKRFAASASSPMSNRMAQRAPRMTPKRAPAVRRTVNESSSSSALGSPAGTSDEETSSEAASPDSEVSDVPEQQAGRTARKVPANRLGAARKLQDDGTSYIPRARKPVIPGTGFISNSGRVAGDTNTRSQNLPSQRIWDMVLTIMYLERCRMQGTRRLPFLRRNLPAAERRPSTNGPRLPTAPRPSNPIPVIVRYALIHADDSNDFQRRLTPSNSWECPLCDKHWHIPMPRREFLDIHLRVHHSQVDFRWEINQAVEWTLSLQFDAQTAANPRLNYVLSKLEAKSNLRAEHRVLDAPDVQETDVTPALVPAMVRVKIEANEDSIRHPSMTSTFYSSDTLRSTPTARSSSAYSREASTLTATDDANRTPKVEIPDEGPADYVPERINYDDVRPAAQDLSNLGEYTLRGSNRQKLYSCRPGGPKLYDLIDLLPMDQFGVLSWYIISQEEEIFEQDDIRDEDKVMLALWNRYMLLNRPAFLFNHKQGVIDFIDMYRDIIRLAAGRLALKVFLMQLNVNRFLSHSDVADAIRHYRGATIHAPVS